MNNDRPLAATPTTADQAGTARALRHRSRIDELAPPLAAKRAALQLRRRSGRSSCLRTQQPVPGKSLQTLFAYGTAVAFALRATPTGLMVERTQRQAVGARLVQFMVFTDRPDFDRWCDTEPTRFEDPHVYDELRRQAHDVLDAPR